MCKRVVGNILGKDVSSKNRYDTYEWKQSEQGVSYLQGKKSKKTPISIIEDINKKFKTK